MVTYITVDDVDVTLGNDWSNTKVKAVLMANAWLNGLSLRLPRDKVTHAPVIPDDVKIAGAYAALAASDGGLYQQKTGSGSLLSKSVDADGVSVSKTFAELDVSSSELLNSNLQLAMALLKPYGLNTSHVRLVRG